MDNIVNYFVLAFIFVFDPLAILLLISANKAFSIVQNNSEEFRSTVEDHRDYFRPPHPSDAYEEEAEQRMDIIGQNGNDGVHYEQEKQKPLEVYGEKPERVKKKRPYPPISRQL